MSDGLQALPEYENPPVVEVVCGVLFEPLDRLLAPYLGLFWEELKSDYPKCQEVPPLAATIERFDEGQQMEVKVSDLPPLPLPRIWFVHAAGQKVIQVQRDRFLHNWRRVEPGDVYPRYGSLITEFRRQLDGFHSFLARHGIGTLAPRQYELTYVNQIPIRSEWIAVSQVGNFFPDFCWRGSAERFLPAPEGINWRTSFRLPHRSGRLHVTIRLVTQRETRTPMLLLDLTARGITQSGDSSTAWQWFDLAHEWIVRAFSDITSEGIQQTVWGRRT